MNADTQTYAKAVHCEQGGRYDNNAMGDHADHAGLGDHGGHADHGTHDVCPL